MKFDPVTLSAVAGAVILLVFLLVRMGRGRRGGTDHVTMVRSYVAAGDYRRAGKMQLKAGNLREAFNLFERGGLNADAAHVAAKLGWHLKAARHAEAAGELERAAGFYESGNASSDASRLYRRVGRFEQAVALLERDAEADPGDIAELWESIYLDRLPKRRGTLDQAGLTALRDAAEAAADAYKRAGKFERALHFIEAAREVDTGNDLPIDFEDQPASAGPTEQPGREAASGERALADDAAERARRAAEAAIRLATRDEEGLTEVTPLDGPPAEGNPFGRGSMTSPIAMPPPPKTPMVQVAGGSKAKLGRVETVARVEVLHIRERDTAQGTGQTDPDRYDIGEELGRGGMAVVFRAHDRILERDVALKFLPEDVTVSESARKLFVREAKAVAKLNHPNIITIHDFGTIGPRPFICMELVEGKPLNRVIDEAQAGRLDLDQALLVADGLLAALELAHSRDVLHRDIKPSNVMVTGDWTAKLMDFGIAKILDSSGGGTTQIAGTPSYMAPEQMVGKGLDVRTDLFAVGVTLYEMTTGYLPFEGLRRDEPPIPPRQLRPELPEEVEALILSCLALSSDERPASARVARRALGAQRLAQAALEVRAATEAAAGTHPLDLDPESEELRLADDSTLDGSFADAVADARDDDETAAARPGAARLEAPEERGEYTGEESIIDLRDEIDLDGPLALDDEPGAGILDELLPIAEEVRAEFGAPQLEEPEDEARDEYGASDESFVDLGDFDEAPGETAAPAPEPAPAPEAAQGARAEADDVELERDEVAEDGVDTEGDEYAPCPPSQRTDAPVECPEPDPVVIAVAPSATNVGARIAASGVRPRTDSGAVEAVADHMVARSESGNWDTVVSAALAGLTLAEVRASLEAEASEGAELDVDVFTAAIVDTRAAVRRAALELYPRFDAELVRLLIRGLRDAERCVRIPALRRIAATREQRFGPILGKYAAAIDLMACDPDERQALFSALVVCGGDDHLDVLARALALLASSPVASDRKGARAEERYARDIVTAVAGRQSEAGVALAAQVRDTMRERNTRRALRSRATQLGSGGDRVAPSARWGDRTPPPREAPETQTPAALSESNPELPDGVEALLRDYLTD